MLFWLTVKEKMSGIDVDTFPLFAVVHNVEKRNTCYLLSYNRHQRFLYSVFFGGSPSPAFRRYFFFPFFFHCRNIRMYHNKFNNVFLLLFILIARASLNGPMTLNKPKIALPISGITLNISRDSGRSFQTNLFSPAE